MAHFMAVHRGVGYFHPLWSQPNGNGFAEVACEVQGKMSLLRLETRDEVDFFRGMRSDMFESHFGVDWSILPLGPKTKRAYVDFGDG